MTRKPRPLDGVMNSIRLSKSIAIVCHISPDGDTIGSALALRLGLLELGKEVTLYCQDKIPDVLRFMPGAEEFRLPEEAEEEVDLLLCVDVSDEKRMGRCKALKRMARHTALIDHHATNTRFCEVCMVDGTAPANCLIINELLWRMDCTMTVDVALCLAVGLSTDTGNLTYKSTTPEAYRVMGDLLETGAPIADAYRHIYRSRPPRQVALLAKALESLTFYHEGKITSMRLTQKDFEECGALPEDTDIIVNYGLDVQGVCLCIFAREQADGSTKMSLRSLEPYDITDVAQEFGGGGHAQAAGATVYLPLDEAINRVVARMEKELEQAE